MYTFIHDAINNRPIYSQVDIVFVLNNLAMVIRIIKQLLIILKFQFALHGTG